MRNADGWSPTKYVRRNGRLRATRDTAYLAIGSRLVADLVAERYDASLRTCARGRLLDLGCGRTPLYEAYRQWVDSVTTVDWNDGASADGMFVDIQHDLNQPLPFTDEEFETVILSDVLEHLRMPQQLCAEVARILTKRGHFVANTPFIYPVHEAPHDYYRFTVHGIRHLLSTAGLEVLVLEPLGGSLDVGCDILAKHLAQLSMPGRFSASLLQSAAAWFGRTRPGARFRRATQDHYACGYFFVARRP